MVTRGPAVEFTREVGPAKGGRGSGETRGSDGDPSVACRSKETVDREISCLARSQNVRRAPTIVSGAT